MREEAAAGCAPGTQAEIPLQSVVKTVVKQIVHLQPMEDHDGAGKHALKEAAAYGDPTLEQAPGRSGECPVLILTHEIFHLIFSLYPVKKGKWKRGWVGV